MPIILGRSMRHVVYEEGQPIAVFFWPEDAWSFVSNEEYDYGAILCVESEAEVEQT